MPRCAGLHLVVAFTSTSSSPTPRTSISRATSLGYASSARDASASRGSGTGWRAPLLLRGAGQLSAMLIHTHDDTSYGGRANHTPTVSTKYRCETHLPPFGSLARQQRTSRVPGLRCSRRRQRARVSIRGGYGSRVIRHDSLQVGARRQERGGRVGRALESRSRWCAGGHHEPTAARSQAPWIWCVRRRGVALRDGGQDAWCRIVVHCVVVVF
ncbi:hypothetical protein B0H11DRAFT_1966496, partial [Mycena galericulata]